jgi:hypothetical protein
VADFCASYHGISGRRDRARSWSNVATLVRRREHQRLSA